MVLTAPLVLSPWAVMLLASAGLPALIGLLAAFDGLALWFVLRFLIGSCATSSRCGAGWRSRVIRWC